MSKIKILIIFFVSCLSNFTFTMRRVFNLSRLIPSNLKVSQIYPFMRVKFPYRNICSLKDYRNSYNIFLKNKEMSPLLGAIYARSGAPQAIYNLANLDQKKSATEQLVTSFFHKQGNQFKLTRLVTNPCSSITPELIAKILVGSKKNMLNLPSYRKNLCVKWKAHHLSATNSIISDLKINKILDIVSASKEEATKKYYLKNTTENILLSALYYKADGKEDINRYLAKIMELPDTIKNQDFINQSNVDIDKELACPTEHIYDSFIKENYEKILLTMLNKKSKQLEQVAEAAYGYNDKKPRPNCVEAGFHQLFNILMYNKRSEKFDLSLLPKSLSPITSLIDFYASQNFETDKINSSSTGKKFMNLVSGHSFLKYKSDDYELKSCVENFIPLMNYIFGINTNDLKKLSELFSDSRRKITFKQNSSAIDISIESEEYSSSKHKFIFNDGHAEFHTIKDEYNVGSSNFSWYWLSPKNFENYPEFISLVEFPRTLNLGRHFIDKEYTIKQVLHLLHVSCHLKHQSQFLELLDVLLHRIKENNYIEKYIAYILNRYKDNIGFINKALDIIRTHKTYNLCEPIELRCDKYSRILLNFRKIYGQLPS